MKYQYELDAWNDINNKHVQIILIAQNEEESIELAKLLVKRDNYKVVSIDYL